MAAHEGSKTKESPITSAEWNTFAPSFMQLAIAGPGVAPAKRMIDLVDAIHPFPSGTTIVDVGCGPGQVTHELLLKHGRDLPASVKIIAADNNDDMLAQVRARQQREIKQGESSWKRVDIVQSDVHICEPFTPGSVSHVLTGFVIFSLADPSSALRSINRTLAPKDILAISSLQSSEWAELMRYPLRIRPDLTMPEIPGIWTTEAGNRRMLEEAGFVDVQVHEAESFMPFESHDEVCRFLLLRFPPAARVCAMMTGEELERTRGLMVEELRRRYSEASGRMEGRALIAIGRKAG